MHVADCTGLSKTRGTTAPAPLKVLHVQSESTGHTAVQVHHEAPVATTSASSDPLHDKGTAIQLYAVAKISVL